MTGQEKLRRVAIQGIAGCFHDEAARSYFCDEEITTIPCDTFPDMFANLMADPSLYGIMAIENTIAGALLQNHELLRRSGMVAVGETRRRISHVLCALPGQSIEDIREVASHPMALMQCDRFLEAHPHLKAVERNDTAGSACEIAEKRIAGRAAICGEYAARLYGLDILASAIETDPHNYTRFLVLAHPDAADRLQTPEEDTDKATIVFTLPHTQGALSKVLTILSFYDINLTKIQSMPIIGREWEYRFHVDLTFPTLQRYRQAIEAVRPLTGDLRIIGEYKENKS